METGISWLYETFPFLKGRINTLWQIDPFGASDLTPLLFSDDYEFALLNRIGDDIKERLKKSKNMDFYWQSPQKEKGIMTHLTNIHYNTEQ